MYLMVCLLFQIEKLAMLSSKESKELCYTLLDEHFISVRVSIYLYSLFVVYPIERITSNIYY